MMPTPEADATLPGPAGRTFIGQDRRARLWEGLRRAGEAHARQTAGRFYPIACAALEITQRCNLDCSLCYLSDRAEAAHDVPLNILIDRIHMLHDHFGSGTSVQISGGDPTLRSTDDIAALCREIRSLGMRSCLMTNGIRATRDRLRALAMAGLDDVAFHVDLTQERAGYRTEDALNAVRRRYLDQARGLGLRILFNTTIFDRNVSEIPAIVRFFRHNARDITLASFQIGADTGRGVVRNAGPSATRDVVLGQIQAAMGCPLDFDATAVGHSQCNRYATVLIAGDRAIDAFHRAGSLVPRMIAALESVEVRKDAHLSIADTLPRLILRHPGLCLRAAAHCVSQIFRLGRGLATGRVSRLAILVHTFMDADALDADRCGSCVFHVATESGPISMCAHNAARDRYVFEPARTGTNAAPGWWSAATGRTTPAPDDTQAAPIPRKLMKGRTRKARS